MKKAAPIFKIAPIGGLRQIGSNLTILKLSNRWILIDIGILFPNDDFYNIDYLIPDLSQIDSTKVTDIIFTHAHEDHIGAVRHLFEYFPKIKIWARPFVADLIRTKFEYAKIDRKINVFKYHQTLNFDELSIEPIHVNHSIPQTQGFYISHKDLDTGVFFASDFKVDLESGYEEKFDFEKLATVKSRKSKTLAMLDSTSILNPGKTPSEQDLIPAFEEIFKSQNGRLFFTLFSSNIFRVQTIVDLCIKYKKRLCLLGRSVERYTEVAQKADVLNIPENLICSTPEAQANSNCIFIVSGCQGDFFGSLRRLVDDQHGDFKLKKTDTVIFSSKVIPGNEKKVYRIYNVLAEKEVPFITARDGLIHASGHASQKDIEIVIDKVKPDYFIPIHGESYFLKKHSELIQNNYPQIKTHTLFNWDEIHLKEDQTLSIQYNKAIDPLIIHGKGIQIERAAISQRRKLACNGSVFISLKRKPLFCKIDLKGLPESVERDIPAYKEKLLQHFKSNLFKKNDLEAQEALRIFFRKMLFQRLSYKPITTVQII